MVATFFANNQLFSSSEIRGVEADTAGRSTDGDAVIGYVQLKREGAFFIVEGRKCLEHKVRIRDYNVSLKITEKDESIVESANVDCAASLGGCPSSAKTYNLYIKDGLITNKCKA